MRRRYGTTSINLPQHLGELTIGVAINRNAEALHDAANLAK
jgi:hypothetical protein